jgi:phosphoribosyl 1,2-cyclic phosphate phosphodiesterase
MHACLPIFGFRIGTMAYLTDLKTLPEEELPKLQGLDVLIIDALKKKGHPSHESMPEALDNIRRIQPKAAYLIHMSHRMGLHADVEKELPPGVYLSYDGLTVHL